ncbi:NAD(P)/FAD-dependent oxidoreductase [Granulicella sp. L46]|uniref:NAD(P)/FAD-dependent oxidoreductase n=1 Tax=Granulicella sp. L46 TaxID=1641865 RepID=UPI0020B13C63|nr:FAD-dependent monooxygenase [Granulicella sp. L46]
MNAEVVVVGGGLAGAAAAIRLARAGRDVVVIERALSAEHKVCGEFLSREALNYLESLGLEVASFGAVPIGAVRLAWKGGLSETKLPFHALSLTRRRLDEELLRLAADAGARVLRGCRVHGIERERNGWRAMVEGGEPVLANAAFLATGKHDLRGRPRPKGKQSDLVAFKMYWRLAPAQAAALEGHVELMLYRGGYAGLQPVEDGAANLCCLVERAELQRHGGRWEHFLAAMQRECGLLRERLQGAQALLERPLAVSAIPYGYVRAASHGVWALGDQAAVIPSFTGDGMSIALHSGCLAAAMYLQGESAEQFQAKLYRELSGQVALATLVSRGLVWAPSRGVLMAMASLRPRSLEIVARRTRISEAALLA